MAWILFFQLPCLVNLSLDAAFAASNISTTDKYAWSENVGWKNWKSTNAQATVGTTYLVGYVWAKNIGWIKLGHTPWAGGQYNNDASDDWGVNRNESDGTLSGYAWSENVGWINFNSEHGGVTINTSTGKFDGYAWGENIGWIHFQNADPEYYVEQSGPLVVDLVSFMATGFADFVRLKWTTATEVDNAGFHLWRSDRANGEYARITDALIPAEGGPVFGADYTFDDENVTPGTSYFYQLEDIDTAGTRTVHGPASAWAGMVNIAANGSDGPLTASGGENVSITVQMRALENAGASFEQWIAADTPFGWYGYQGGGWQSGIHRTAVSSPNDVGPTEVLNMALPTG